ncbi:MAG: hypothetical protein M1833_006459 [Piccolia ochrophora]|nr:MAG: hypothetical protein M1833_006459 [Piccolia ochrophora]
MTLSVPSFVRSVLGRSARGIQDRPSQPASRLKDVLRANWLLGFTAFGGPPVHFQIFHQKFVEERGWIDEQMYQELFGICQAMPGPASTKMLFCINWIHGGFIAALVAFSLWCLPGAIGMYGLSLGISRIGEDLPPPVDALLSGLNAATVGIIALAAVQLAQKAITDKISRALVFLGGSVGMLYTALWFFPVLMLSAGMVTVAWDLKWLHGIYRLRRRDPEATHRVALQRIDEENSISRVSIPEARGNDANLDESVEGSLSHRRVAEHRNDDLVIGDAQQSGVDAAVEGPASRDRSVPPGIAINLLTWKMGVCIMVGFTVSFFAVMLLRGLLSRPPLGFALFANLYLAGTIIFGGGPVVIPLLREYIVAEGWVSPRDFLLGLALIQSFPGPNFNFAVYLGALATSGTSLPSAVGALVAAVGIFAPGLIIAASFMTFWKTLRSRQWVRAFIRGVSASAVGLVYTAVYRLWQIGLVDATQESGSPLGTDPWWVAVTATSFVGGAWFGLSAPFAILLGGVMGMVWYAIVKV